MEIITRDAAKDAGQSTYFTGKPCTNGHTAARRVINHSCVSCAADEQRKRLSKKAASDPTWLERNRTRSNEWRKKNPERERERQKKYREANREKNASSNKKWRAENAERHRQTQKEWIKNNPEKHRASRAARFHRRRARMKEAGGTFSSADIVELHRKQRGRCVNCRQKRILEVDHIKPISRGGANHISNLQLLCGPCNRRKSDKDPIKWTQENGRLL